MTFLRLVIERTAVRVAQTCQVSKISYQKIHNSCVRWAQDGARPKGLSDLQRLKSLPQPKLKRERASRFVMVTLAAGAFLFKFGPHTFLVESGGLQSHYQHHTKGFATRVPPKLRALVEEVMEECQLTPQQIEENGNVFMGTPTEPYAWGNFDTRFLLMLPFHLTFDSAKDVPGKSLKFGASLRSDSDSSSGPEADDREAWISKFSENVYLTENAKKFVIAREIERTKTPHFVFPALILPLNIISMYVAAKWVNKSFALFALHPSFRLSAYLLQGFFWTFVSITEMDILRKKMERNLDDVVSAKDREYALGGVEFYTKMMGRNVALRHLIPNDKGKMYNLKGEHVPGLIRHKHVPYTERKSICEKNLSAQS